METWTRLVRFSRQRVVSRKNNPRQGKDRETNGSPPHLRPISVFWGVPILRDCDREAQQLGTRGSGVKYLAPIRTYAVARIEHLFERELDPEAFLQEFESSVFGKDGTAVFGSFHPPTPNWIFPWNDPVSPMPTKAASLRQHRVCISLSPELLDVKMFPGRAGDTNQGLNLQAAESNAHAAVLSAQPWRTDMPILAAVAFTYPAFHGLTCIRRFPRCSIRATAGKPAGEGGPTPVLQTPPSQS